MAAARARENVTSNFTNTSRQARKARVSHVVAMAGAKGSRIACLTRRVCEWTERKPHRYLTNIDSNSDKKLVKIRFIKPPFAPC